MKIVKKDNGNFEFQKEVFYDGKKSGLDNLIFMLCDSAELDFIVEDAAMTGSGRYHLLNINTDKGYIFTNGDADIFDREEVLKAESFEPDASFKELFSSYFTEV